MRARVVLGLGLVATALSPARADRGPQYRLDVGDRLIYERRAAVTTLDSHTLRSKVNEQVQVWCLQKQEHAALILIELSCPVKDQARPAQTAVLYIDERGRRRFPAEMTTRLGPLDAALDTLPVLPLGAQSLAAWVTPPDPYERRWRCTGRAVGGPGAERLLVNFTLEDPTGASNALGQTCSGSYWFDPTAGVVTQFESVLENRRAGTSTSVVGVLRERLRQSPQWSARRADEAARFLRSLNHEDRLLQQIIEQPDLLARTQAELERLWAAFESDVEARALSPFVPLADARRQSIRAAAPTLEAHAALGRRWFNRPAGTWTLQDAAGETVPCEAIRARSVIIECFWSGDSIWGARALEPIRQLQADLPPRFHIRVVCYNTDREVERARAAIADCGGGLTQILGGPLAEVESLPELPIVRVLDHESVVRGIWIGWDPTYAAARDLAIELARQIRR